MNEKMAVEILEAFENGAETVALNDDNSEWKSGSNWGPDWADVDFDGFSQILSETNLDYLIG